MALQCATAALALLPRPSLQELKTGVTAAKTALSLAKAGKEAARTSIEFETFKLDALKSKFQDGINQIKDNLPLIPKDVVLKCNELGQLNVALTTAATAPLENMTNLLFDIERLTASKLTLNLEIKQLDDTIAFMEDMIDAIDLALTSAT